MLECLHGRALRRLASERSREARERLLRFPIELGALKKNLADLVEVTFAPSTFQTTPMFRGFYFTSGTQEGAPLDRALEKMSAAMGIKTGPRASSARVEPKSYFIHDLFSRIISKKHNPCKNVTRDIRSRIQKSETRSYSSHNAG